MKGFKHILTSILIAISGVIWGQSYELIPRNNGITPNAVTGMPIHIPASVNIVLNGNPADILDAVQLFHDSSDVQIPNATGGALVPGNQDAIAAIPRTNIVGMLGWKNGFDENDELIIKIRDQSEACFIESTNYTLKSGLTTFRGGDKDTLISFSGVSSSITYDQSTVCNSRTDVILPTITGPVASVKFTNNSGLSIDSITGGITPDQSTPGVHWIKYNTLTCLSEDSVQFEILANTGIITWPQLTFCKSDTNSYTPTLNVPVAGLQYKTLSTSFIINNATGTFKPSDNDIGTHNVFAESTSCLANSNVEIEIVNNSGDITYPISGPICNSNLDTIAPTISGVLSNLRFRSTVGLIIDSLTGGIIPNQSSVGMHTIYYETSSCIAVDSLIIQIDPASGSVAPGNSSFCFFDDSIYEADAVDAGPNAKFKSLNPLFTVDSTSGGFRPSDGPVGTHIVEVTSNNCLSNTTYEVIITDVATTVTYPILCSTTEELVSPIVNGSASISYFSSPAGLSIDENSGEIDLTTSVITDYTIELQSDDCLMNTSVPVSILRPSDVFTDDFEITPSSCIDNTLGFILLDTSSSSSLPSLDVALFDENNIFIESFSSRPMLFDSLIAGNYSLEISEFSGICTQKLNISIDSILCMTQNLGDGNAVIHPTSTSGFDKIMINCDSEYFIYDRNSKLIRTLSNQDFWDGTLENGQIAPTGLYIIFCGDRRLGEVTVIQE